MEKETEWEERKEKLWMKRERKRKPMKKIDEAGLMVVVVARDWAMTKQVERTRTQKATRTMMMQEGKRVEMQTTKKKLKTTKSGHLQKQNEKETKKRKRKSQRRRKLKQKTTRQSCVRECGRDLLPRVQGKKAENTRKRKKERRGE